jgi:hypothetical protein
MSEAGCKGRMRDPATYLRRSLTLLEWIGSSYPEARVTLGSVELGRWRDLGARWQLDGDKIRLQMRRIERNAMFWVGSVRAAPWGATVRIWDQRQPAEEIRVIWKEPEAASKLGRSRMLMAAREWLRSILPGCRILSACQAPDRAHTISGSYLRIRLRYGDAEYLMLASAEETDEARAQEILGQALLWLSHLSARSLLRTTPTVYLLVPEGRSAVLCHRSKFINPARARIEVREYRESAPQQWEVRQPDPPVTPIEDRDFRWPVLGPFRWSSLLARVMDLAPATIQRYPRFHDYDSLRIWGLEFARVLGPERDRITYGIGSPQVELSEDNFEDLRVLVGEIVYYRRADGPATEHPYYRMQAERWLECLLLNEIAYLFPELAPGLVYPQIPVYLGKIPGRVDILGADREGNLVVMELKVTEDPDMPLQSLDYWGRVIGHNLSGDFERRGYFAGIRLSRTRPKIYLVSPVFSFHDSLERVLRCLDANLEVSKIAINENWRWGAKILHRSDYKCGDLA